ncbi:murein biosynthesis integral membrane protein MurJ [Arcobacter sp.]|uniref:murein biosynthesis integral membrane protein MurJ n=1 Tax=Arcobacter sp. TaxID=1872629 RepID=UPI003D0EE074
MRHILINSFILSFGLLLGRLSGYIRELIIAYKFEVSKEADNIILMLNVPDLLNNLLAAGAVSGILIPLLSKEKEVEYILNEFTKKLSILTLIVYFSIGIVIFFYFEYYIAALLMISLISVFPNILTFVASSYLQYEHRFKVQSMNTLIFNSIIIIFLLLGFYNYLFAFSIIFASILRMVWVVNDLKYTEISFTKFFKQQTKNLIQYKLMIFMILANGLIFINPMLDKLFASFLQEGSVAVLSYAEKIYLLPVSVFLTTYAVAMFPSLSKMANELNFKEINAILIKSISFNIFISLIVGVLMYIYSDFIVQLFYGVVNIKLENLFFISHILKGYIISLVFAGSLSILLNLFFAFRLYRIMIFYSIFIVLIKILSNVLIVYFKLDVYFIAFSTSLITCISFLLLIFGYIIMKRKEF